MLHILGERMTPPRKRDDEARSIAALRDLAVLDTAPESVFDALVRAASLVCGVPISLVSLIDVDRQWFKANVGLPGVSETPRDVAFCAHAVLDDAIFEVSDATVDGRFADNPLVLGAPFVRFYAGVPLKVTSGHRIGTLCVIDHQPRTLTPHQREVLAALGTAAAQALDGRRAMETVADTAVALARSEQELQAERQRLGTVIEAAEVGTWEFDLVRDCATGSDRWAAIVGETVESVGGLSCAAWEERVHPDDRVRVAASFHAHLDGMTESYASEHRVRHRDGHWVWVAEHGRVMTRSDAGAPVSVVGARMNVSTRRARDERLRMSEDFLTRTGNVAGVGGWQLDTVTGALHWSDETFRIHGVPVGTPTTVEQAISFYPPAARAEVETAIATCIGGGPDWDLELPFIRATGEKIWVRAVGSAEREDGKVVRLVGAFQDVTARVSERIELERINERVALATDSGGIGIWEYNLQTRDLVWDDWMYRIYGTSAEAGVMTYERWQRLVTPESRARIAAAVQELIAGRAPFELDFEVVDDSGVARELRSSGRLAMDSEGRRVRFVGATWNVTEARQVARALERQNLINAIQADIAMAANHAHSLHEVLATCTTLICQRAHIEVGHSYLRSADDGLLMPSGIWRAELESRFDAFREETSRTQIPTGFGLVGRALEARRPTSTLDLSSTSLLRHRSAAQCGLRWGLAAPILVGDEAVAILEFFGTDPRDCAPWLVDVIAYAGVQIGRVVDRARARAMLEQRSESLRAQSLVDELTGLYNRRGFLELAEDRRRLAQASGQRIFLLFADLDGMKQINDQLGHEQGDRAIRETAQLLRRTLRGADIVARLGGDEFVAVAGETGAFNTESLLGRLRHELERVNRDDGLPFRLEVSFGIAEATEPSESLPDIIKRADEAMYREKVARKQRARDGAKSSDAS